MCDEKLKRSLDNLGRALTRLGETLKEDQSNSLVVDATIHRLNVTIELYWKTLKRALQVEGIETKTPKESLKEAYQVGWLNEEKLWLEVLKDRTETSQAYEEEKANEIVRHVHSYFPELTRTFHLLNDRFGNDDS